MPNAAPAAILDLDTTLRFVRSSALAMAISEGTNLEWKTYNDSAVLNIAYALLPWKEKPGWVEVNMSSGRELEDRFAAHYLAFGERWLDRLGDGPDRMAQYLEHLGKTRELAMDRVNSIFHDAREINDEIDQQLRTSIRQLAGIKLAGTLAVAGLSGGAALAIGGTTAAAAGGISAGFSITCAVIKEWQNVPTAKVVAVSKEAGKYVAGEALNKASETLLEKAGRNKQLHEEMLQKAIRQIAHYERMIEQTARQRVARRAGVKLVERQVRKEVAEQGLEQAAKLAKAGKVVKVAAPIVFAVWDAVEGVMDFQETWEATR